MNEIAAKRHKECQPVEALCELRCGPATHLDIEGIALCCECWEEAPLAEPDPELRP